MAKGIVVPVAGDTRRLEKDIAKIAGKPVQLQKLNSKNFTQPLGKIRGDLGEFEKSLEASNARVIAFGASAGAIYAVGDALRQTVKSMLEVEKSLAEVNVILGTSEKALASFGNELFNIARNTQQSFGAVATAATELARQGLGIEETLKRTNNALILTRLSGLGVVDSVNAITAAINGFSKAALDSTQIVNRLIAVDQAFAVSGADLAEGLKRVGNTAEGAGVSFNQLLAVITAAQQITARGGAVIGNSFKTIFTRIQRPRTIEALEALGIATKDASGSALGAIGVLDNLAKGYDRLAASQQAQIAELVGGVFQINILKATLADLGKEYSVYGNSLRAANTAVNEADTRNAQLNKTLTATINATVATAQQAAAALGKITLEPALKRSLGLANKILAGFDPSESKSAGEKIGKGILEGVGTFLGGPGLLLVGVGLYKLFEKLRTFAADAFRTVTGLTSSTQKRATIEKRVHELLSQEPALLEQIKNKDLSIAQAHNVILALINAETRALHEQTRVVGALGGALAKSGRVTPFATQAGSTGLSLTNEGRIPNFTASPAARKEAREATAKYGSVVSPKDTFPTVLDVGAGRKQLSQVNKRESIIRKKDSKKVFGAQADGDTVIAGGGKPRQQNIASLKQKLFASKGMVPNFALSQRDLEILKTSSGAKGRLSPDVMAARVRFDADPTVQGMRDAGRLNPGSYAVSTYAQMLPRYLKEQGGVRGEQPRLNVLGAVHESGGANERKRNIRQYGFKDAAALGRFNTNFPTRYEEMIDGMATDVLSPLPAGKTMLGAFKAKPLDAAAFGHVKGRVWESFVTGMTDVTKQMRKGDEPIDIPRGENLKKEFQDLFTPGMPTSEIELRLQGAAGTTSKKARQKMGLEAEGLVPNFDKQFWNPDKLNTAMGNALEEARSGNPASFQAWASESGIGRSTLQNWTGLGKKPPPPDVVAHPDYRELKNFGKSFRNKGQVASKERWAASLGMAFEREFAEYMPAIRAGGPSPIDFLGLPAATDKRMAIRMEPGYRIGDTIWGKRGHGDTYMADKILRLKGLPPTAKRQASDKRLKNVDLGDYNVVEILGQITKEQQPGLVPSQLKATGSEILKDARLSTGGGLRELAAKAPNKIFTLDYKKDYVSFGAEAYEKMRASIEKSDAKYLKKATVLFQILNLRVAHQ